MELFEVEETESLPETYLAVVGVLREGKAEAITSTDILRLTGLKDQRNIYEIIEQLIIQHGYAIGASRTGEHKGYYLISNQKELRESLHSYNEQIQSMLKRHKKLRENYLIHTNLFETGN